MTTLSEYIKSKITRIADNRSQVKENKEQRKTLYCHYWNNGGSCNFEERNGRRCRFEHKEAPTCNFDGNCTHKKKNNFLENRTMGFRPPPHQPWEMLMNVLGLHGMNSHGQSRRGNQKRYYVGNPKGGVADLRKTGVNPNI